MFGNILNNEHYITAIRVEQSLEECSFSFINDSIFIHIHSVIIDT